mgnify:CR=1 FL=1
MGRDIADFVDREVWNVAMLNQHLDEELVGQVLAVLPPSFRGTDKMLWVLTNSCIFSTSSAYSLVRRGNNRSWFSAYVWQQGFPIKISFFML